MILVFIWLSMCETNESFENRIMGSGVYQIVQYFKSKINQNRVVLELKLTHSCIVESVSGL